MSLFTLQNINLDISNKHIKNSNTLPLIEECMMSRYHDIGCDCFSCRKCREEIIDFYKNRKKRKKSKMKNEMSLYQTKSIPIPIPQPKKTIPNSIDKWSFSPKSLPNLSLKKEKKILNNRCIVCKSEEQLNVVNDFYVICNSCEEINESIAHSI